MNASSLLYPMTAHMALTAILYALLTLVRAPDAWGVGLRADGTNPWARFEPGISANLSNQFEWPLFFYVVCLIFLSRGGIDHFQIWMAWIFVAGRYIHSFVQIITGNIQLRGLVFTINFVALLAMWGELLFRL